MLINYTIKKGGTKMISFNLPPISLLWRIGSLILTAWLYLLFVLMTARYSRSALKFMLQMFLPILAVVLSRWFGFFPAIILCILYVFLSLPVREEPELKFMGMVLFGLSLIPINIFIKMLVAL